MEFRVLGPVEYGNPEHPVRLGGPKQRAVFALLVKDAGDVVSSESLIDGVWGDEPPGAVRNSLHTYVSNLRSILGGKIERSGNGYLLDVDHAQVDAVLFERLVDESRSALSVDPAASGTTLRAALSLWRGRPYADLLDIPGLADEIRRLEELRLLTVEARVDADLATGRHEIVIPELEALAADYPLREGFRARHMIALYRNGRQAEALRAYNRTREFLGDELGVEPSPELAELEERILQHDPELLSAQDVRTEQVAFLFTDLEASTVLWETRPEQMRDDLAVHDEMLTKAIADAGGRVFKHTGDGILAAFGTVTDAARSAAHAQQQLAAADWGALETLRVRMSLDVGEVDARGGDYFGAPMNRGARLMAAAHGGQIVLSAAAQDQLRHESGVQIKSLGEHRFKGLGKPQDVFQLLVPGLQTEFPPLRVDAAAPDAGRQFGDSIRGYEIRERIGAGRFGMVYRAYQPSVGREVAVKVIRREYANHPVFVRRFEAEARLVAKLEHPHIVSLYDFWRDHDGAYLVMPYLVGRSLSGARYGALPTETVAAILRQIGAALSYAHRQGVIHRDVKPANILLDADGNAYLADFGIAVRAVEHSAGLTPSSQTFRAPEDRDGGAVDERTDVYSLAAVTAELLTGQTPTSGDLPVTSPSMQQALKRGLEEDPAARFPTIDSFVAALLNGAGMPASTATVPPIVSRNPYKGLAAFNEADARDFYGRDAEVADLLRLIRKQRFVTVVGPSGSGKSSLVQAGLVPALRAGRVAGSTDWLIAKTVPGAHPADELATALGDVAMQQLGDIAAELGADEHGLLRVSKQLTRETDSELLVVIDQFEELFSLVPDERTRAGFVDSLLAAIDDPHSRLRIVATIRADFFDQPLLDDRLGPVVCSALLALSVPGPEALLEAIERPAAAAGVQFEPGLAHQIVADVRDEPGGLPLMQFVLSDLVDRSELGHVDAAAYVDTGGVHGALSRRAARVLEQLDDRDRGVAEQIFLRLVAVSEDADDVRRRVRRSELESLGLDAGSVRNVLDTFGSARLLTFDRDPITRGPTVEVAHEALLREWDQLRRWVVDRRESLLIRRRLELALAEWRGSGESEDLLPAGGRLAQFEEWADNPATNLTEYEREFLIAAAELQTGQAAERERRRRAVMGGFVVAALVATVLALAAWVSRGDAQDAASLAGQRQLAAEEAQSQADANAARADAAAARASVAEANAVEEAAEATRQAALAEARELVLASAATVDPELGAHLALRAVDAFQTSGEVPSSAVDALRRAVASIRMQTRIPGGGFVSVSHDASLLATRGVDGGAALWDLASETLVDTLDVEGAEIWSATFSETLPELYVEVGYEDETRGVDQVWDITAREWAGELPGSHYDVNTSSRLEVSHDGGLVAMTVDDMLSVYRRDTGEIAFESPVAAIPIAISVDDRLAFVEATDGERSTIQIVDAATAQQPLSTDAVPFLPEGMSFAPDGSRLAAVTTGGRLAVFDARDGSLLWLRDDLDRARTPVWYAGGTRLVIGGEGLFEVLDGSTGDTIRQIPGTDGTQRYTMIPDTDLLVIGGASEAQIVDLSDETRPEIGSFVSTEPRPGSLHMTDSGELFLADFPSHLLVDARTGDVIEHWPGGDANTVPNNWGFAVFSRQGGYVAGLDEGGQFQLWSRAGGSPFYTAPDGWFIRGVNDDGSLVVIHRDQRPDRPDAGTRLVSVADGAVVADLAAGPIVTRADFSIDGAYVVTNNNGTDGDRAVLRVWDVTDGHLIAELGDFDSAEQLNGWWHDFTPDGSKLVIGGYEGIVRIVDFDMVVGGADPQDTLIKRIDAHDNFILRVKVSADGSMIASSSWDEPAKLWDLETGRPLGEFGTTERTAIAFHPTEPWLYTAEGDTVTIHTLDIDELIEIANSRLTRDMTDDECQRYLRRGCAEA